MKHLFLVDPLEKLNIKKDSSLYLAARFADHRDVFLLFGEDLRLDNTQKNDLEVYSFSSQFKADGFYLESFSLIKKELIELNSEVVIHMRYDPPYDERYHRTLWKLDYLEKRFQCRVVNKPKGIMQINEKLSSFDLENAISSEVHPTVAKLKERLLQINMNKEYDAVVVKPLNSFSGFGVHKIEMNHNLIEKDFLHKIESVISKIDYEDIILQPYIKKVESGEMRIICLGDNHLGSIIKTPPKGEFLSNIAQGASFEKFDPPKHLLNYCLDLSKKYLKEGLYFIAYDVLGESVTEMNVTCPGLLVETDFANKRDSSLEILNFIENL